MIEIENFLKRKNILCKEEMMKKLISVLMVGMVVFGLGMAYGQTAGDVSKHPSCPYCGMDREKFGHSRMLIEYDDGSNAGLCSLHCASIELALHIDKTPRVIWVGDYNSKKLIDAERAFWVIGGNRPGVMTRRAKWAFEKKEEAEEFVKANGGSLSTFEEAIKAAYEDMYADTKMIRERRKMRRMEHKK